MLKKIHSYLFPYQIMFNENHSIFNYTADEPAHPVGGTSEPHKTSPPPMVSRALAICASMVIVLAGVKAASGLLGPIMLALFLAIILLIPLRFLQRNHVPAFLSYLLVIGGAIALFIVLTYFIGKSLNEFIGKIPAYKDRFTEKYTQVEKQFERFGFVIGNLTETLKQGGNIEPVKKPETSASDEAVVTKAPETAAIPAGIVKQEKEPEKNVVKNVTQDDKEEDKKEIVSDNAEQDKNTSDDDPTDEENSEPVVPFFSRTPSIDKELPSVKPEDVEKWVRNVHDESPSLITLDPQNVMYWIANVFLQLRHLVESGFLVLIFTVFMLFEASQFSAKVDKAFGKEGAINNHHLHQIARDIRRYLVLKTIVNFASGGAAMFVYWLFGVPAWFFWGIIAFFLYYIPNIGGTLAAVIPGILIFVNYDLPGVFLYGMCLIAIECTIAYGFEPRFLGHGLGLSTVVILLTLVFWGWILGPIGLFLAAPLTVMIKIILQAFPETKWIAIMLDDRRAVNQSGG
jgi:predicted PurR-regulated permease PerM